MITGRTKTVGIIGWPVEHSFSPPMQNASFVAAGLDFVYVPLPAVPEYVPHIVSGLKALGFAGANVTIPHKVAIMPYLDELDESAKLAGAVNTIVIKEGRAVGYNTDGAGFIRSLTARGVKVNGKRAVLLGAGGAAKAVICGFLQNGIADIAVGGRNAAKIAAFIAQLPQAKGVSGTHWEDKSFSEALATCDILVNCTPIGMYPHVDQQVPLCWEVLNKQAVVCDLIYNPRETAFLRQARERGHMVISGDGMLVEQGALAFSLWTGQQAPLEIMYTELARALGGNC